MVIYTIDYDNHSIETHSYEAIANYDAFTRELDELYGEWYDNYSDAQEALVADTDRIFTGYAGVSICKAKEICLTENLDFEEEFWKPFLRYLNS